MSETSICNRLEEELCVLFKHICVKLPADESCCKQLCEKLMQLIQKRACYCLLRILMVYNHRIGMTEERVMLTPQSDRRVMKAKKLIEENFDQDLCLMDIAESVGLTKSSFCHLFKQHLSMTFLEYWNFCRVNRAITLLLETDASIDNISFQCGFSCSRHFSRTFKKLKGKSPGEFRNLH